MWKMATRVRRTIIYIHTSIPPYPPYPPYLNILCKSTTPRPSNSILVGSTAEASGKSSCYRKFHAPKCGRGLSSTSVRPLRHLHPTLSTMSSSAAAFLTVPYPSTTFSPARFKSKSARSGARPDPANAIYYLKPILYSPATLQ